MARGDRSAKRLAQRIDVGYLKRPHAFRTWRFYLAIAVPAVALLWVLGLALLGRQQVHSSGPLSTAHSVFGAQCQLCHTYTLGVFRRHAEDQACLACHDGPAHQPNVTSAQSCGSCHREHQGPLLLAKVNDSSCAECHGQLQAVAGAPRFEKTITSFNTQHPEFAALRNKTPDPGTLRFNHQTHLKPNLKGPRGEIQLVCSDCHRQDPSGAWPYGDAAAREASPGKVALLLAENTAPSRQAIRHMVAPKYAQACAGCHALRFDARMQSEVPHETPAVVRGFVQQEFRALLTAQAGVWRSEAHAPRRQLPDARAVRPPASPEAWLTLQVASAETLLWRKTCAECHSLTMKENGLPQIAPPAMTPVWMPHARFDHTAHRLLDCQSCHAVGASMETSDVLLPGIATCQQCHRSGDAAENRCFLCHTYHDWKQKKVTPGKFTLDEILGKKSR